MISVIFINKRLEDGVRTTNYDYECGYAMAVARGAASMIADEFAQVYADVCGPVQGLTPAQAWEVWKTAVGQEHTERTNETVRETTT
jgi:hypothetical protein